MGGLSINFTKNEVNTQKFKSANKEKVWNEAKGMMDRINRLATDTVEMDGSSADLNKNPKDILLLNKKSDSEGTYSAHVKYDKATGMPSGEIETEDSKMTLTSDYPRVIYTERENGSGIEKRAEYNLETGRVDYKHLHGADRDKSFPGKKFTIKAGESENFTSLGRAKAYKRGMEIKEQVETIGRSLAGLDGTDADRNPQKGYVRVSSAETGSREEVQFNTKADSENPGFIQRLKTKDDEGIKHNKTIHADRIQYSTISKEGQETYIEFNNGDAQYISRKDY